VTYADRWSKGQAERCTGEVVEACYDLAVWLADGRDEETPEDAGLGARSPHMRARGAGVPSGRC
jgi:hypothetical protein